MEGIDIVEEPTELDTILNLVESGGEEILTEEELVDFSNYKNALYSTTDRNDHFVNIAEHIDDQDKHWLNKLGNEVVEWVENDYQSRKDWMTKEERGIRLLGVTSKTVGGGDFEGASKVVHPLLIEACTQFQARAIAEMWPPEGPVKTVTIGEVTDEKVAQADRVQTYMNYQYTVDMPGAFEEEDKMLFRLPISGSCFKKTFYDPLSSSIRSSFIESSVFIVPYSATSLRTAIRFTEKFEESENETKKKIAAGVYRDFRLKGADYGSTENTIVEDVIDDTEGRQFVEYEGDHEYVRYECYCYLDIPGFEDVDEKGEVTGIALPYVVTVDFDDELVLSIRRNWDKGDLKKKSLVYYTHYRFLPGLGFYGYGLIHAIGGLAESATGALRALLDAAGFANTKGGYRSRDAKIVGGDKTIGMGEWREVDSTADELKQAFFPLPYDEPSPTLFKLLGLLDDLGRRFASTTENMVGDASNSGPVGTTLALIEQGSKVFSAIHLRLHHSHKQEFQLLGWLNGKYLPDEYPYSIPGQDKYVLSLDFDERVDIIPVSDPNTISDTQRISRAQGALQLAEQKPDLYDMRVAHKSMLVAMRVQNIDELMPPPEEVMPADPVTEMASLMRGEPIKAFMEQDHEAHIKVHEDIFSTFSEDDQEALGAQYMAHVAEHKAFDIVLYFEELMGTRITPENQEEVTYQAAQVSQIYVGENPVEDSEAQKNKEFVSDQERKNADTMGGIKRKDLETAAKIQRDNDSATAEIERQAGREINDAIGEAATALGLKDE